MEIKRIRQEMDTLQSNVDYLSNKIDIPHNDSINNEQFNFDQNIISTQGIECVTLETKFGYRTSKMVIELPPISLLFIISYLAVLFCSIFMIFLFDPMVYAYPPPHIQLSSSIFRYCFCFWHCMYCYRS